MLKAKQIYFALFFLFSALLFSQKEETLKNLRNEIAASKNDTTKVIALINLSDALSNAHFKEAIIYANEGLDIALRVNFARGEAKAYNSLGDVYWFHSDYDKAQQYYFKAYRISDSLHDQKSIAFSLYNIGWILCIQQHSYKDVKYFYKSLQIYQSLNDKNGILTLYNAIASSYVDRTHDNKNVKANFDSSLLYFNKGIELGKKSGMSDHLGSVYGNLGDLFYNQKDFKTSKFYVEKSVEIYRRLQDSTSLIMGYINLGKCDMQTGDIKAAITKLNISSSYNERHGSKDMQTVVLKALAESYYKLGKFKEGYDYYDKYVLLQQQVDKEKYSTNISNLQGSYSLEKAEANVEQLKQTNEIQVLKNKKNSYFIVILLAVALIVIVAAVFLFRQNKLRQLINAKLHLQNQVIADKKHEIDNSIQYAKGIQQAILPDEEELAHEFEQSFIYYKPKDVVSGDFYWFSKVGDEFYCIAADCTGHGVPGALMSIIGIDKIVQAVYEKQITIPGKILSFLNLQIKKVLKQHSDASKQKDGMDIALLKFNSSHEVEFSGANRPLYIVRNNELLEYKPNKTAIAGFTADDQEFATTSIPLYKNDNLFIFTDGYADQFGGPEGKKFMSKNLKSLLVSISELPSNQQHQKIETAFMDWKQDYEQVDDVLVIGIKI